MLNMWDTITPYSLVGHIPASGDAVAGYVGGNSWPDYWQLVSLFPNAKHLSIGGRNENARCIDVESGFATLGDIPYWLNNHADTSQGPAVIYTFASNMQAAINVARSVGKPFKTWSAHFTFVPHICGPRTCGYPQADATQWTDRALPGRDADQSLVADGFFPADKPPPDPDPYRFLHFFSAKYPGGQQGGPWDLGFGAPLDERDVVMHYYGAYPHPAEYVDYLTLLRAELTSLAGRVAQEALYDDPNPDGTPSWGKYMRGERYQRLIHMGQGGKPQ